MPYTTGYTFSLIFLFENIVSTNCSVISSIMENFVIIHSQKSREKTELENNIDKEIENGNIVCVTGGSGVGKTYACRRVLEEYSFIEITQDMLKSRRTANDILEKLAGTPTVMFFDDVQLESYGMSVIIEMLQNPRFVHGPVLFNIRNKLRFESVFSGLDIVYFDIDGPNKRNEIISVECKERFGLEVSALDDFYTTNDNIYDLICTGGKGYKRFIGKGIEEHGHMTDLIFSNYKCETIEDAAALTDSMSYSDTFDTKIYEGNWDFLCYFTAHACVIPSKITGNKMDYKKLSPGTVWTKHCNQSLREKNFRLLQTRSPHSSLDINFVSYFMKLLSRSNAEKAKELCDAHNLKSQDLDLMNHLVATKLKGKVLNIVKKHLKQHGTQVRRY